jgi:uncharacterized HAD superfamily protein
VVLGEGDKGVRIIFDIDGTITDGAPPTKLLHTINDLEDYYLAAKPYDVDTMKILEDVARRHEVFLLTARSWDGARHITQQWFDGYGINPGEFAGIITHIHGNEKYWVAKAIKAHLAFDDARDVYGAWRHDNTVPNPTLHVMHSKYVDHPCKVRVGSWKEVESIIKTYETIYN